uniref:Uncharacterized protein n=1 Tax=Triticum urartu TaxID=4572 RepID=A0A8R7UF03_TRIUA
MSSSVHLHLDYQLSSLCGGFRVLALQFTPNCIHMPTMWIFQGMVFSPIPFQPDDLLAKHEAPAPDEAELPESVPRTSLVSTIAESFKQMLFPSCN